MDNRGPARGSPAPARRLEYPGRRTLIGILVGVAVLGFLGARLFFSLQGEARCGVTPLTEPQRAPCQVATRHVHAVAAGDWAAAQGELSAALQATTTPGDLQGLWSGGGEVARFVINLDPNPHKINATTAYIDGALEFRGDRRESVVIALVLEDDTWKIGRVPYD